MASLEQGVTSLYQTNATPEDWLRSSERAPVAPSSHASTMPDPLRSRAIGARMTLALKTRMPADARSRNHLEQGLARPDA